MTKFFKIKDTEIRKVYECNDNGEKIRVVALIGQVAELLKKEIIYHDNTAGNYNKWLALALDGASIYEFETLKEAKTFVTENYKRLCW